MGKNFRIDRDLIRPDVFHVSEETNSGGGCMAVVVIFILMFLSAIGVFTWMDEHGEIFSIIWIIATVLGILLIITALVSFFVDMFLEGSEKYGDCKFVNNYESFMGVLGVAGIIVAIVWFVSMILGIIFE